MEKYFYFNTQTTISKVAKEHLLKKRQSAKISMLTSLLVEMEFYNLLLFAG